jgi:hypothetical protein
MTRLEYAVTIFLMTLSAVMCRIGLHHDGTDAFGGYSTTCLRCRGTI